MFQFPGFAPSRDGDRSSTCRVAPFGYVRIKSCLQIPAPFRSLPRPSSPPDSLGILRSLFVPFSEYRIKTLRRFPPPQHDFRHSERSEESQYRESHISMFALAYEIVVHIRLVFEKTLLLQTIFYLCFYLLIFSLSIVNELFPPSYGRKDAVFYKKDFKENTPLALSTSSAIVF